MVTALVLAPDVRAAMDEEDPPAGANDWACRPTAAHPNPVVLVHGTGARAGENWGQLSPVVADAGYCVFALTYGRNPAMPPGADRRGGMIRMEESAAELGTFVDRVLAETGAAEVDVVGHSQGSLMPNYYAKFLGGASRIGRYVGITPLWDGTDVLLGGTMTDAGASSGLSGLVWDVFASEQGCEACEQFLTGSDFMEQMSSGGGPRVDGIAYTMLMTRYDELVVPYTSGFMEGATNIVVQDVCPGDVSEHVAMAVDPVVHQLVLNALDPADAAPVDCGLPVVGYLDPYIR